MGKRRHHHRDRVHGAHHLEHVSRSVDLPELGAQHDKSRDAQRVNDDHSAYGSGRHVEASDDAAYGDGQRADIESHEPLPQANNRHCLPGVSLVGLRDLQHSRFVPHGGLDAFRGSYEQSVT